MPSRLFWYLERNISRVRAEADIRAVRVANAAPHRESTEGLMQSLAAEIGETAEIKRNVIVRAEADAKQKFLRAMGS